MALFAKTQSLPDMRFQARQGICLCGQEIYSEDDMPIYCSSACARSDAMAALIGRGDRCALATARRDRGDKVSSTAHRRARLMSEASQRYSASSFSPVGDMSKESEGRINIWSSGAGLSHYRRMGMLNCKEGEDEDVDDVDKHLSKSTDSRDRMSLFTLNRKQALGVRECTFEQEYRLRLDLAEMEAGLRESVCSLDGSTYLFDPNMTPVLDCYEDPVGWEGGGQAQSTNFLGLFQMHSIIDDNLGLHTDSTRCDMDDECGLTVCNAAKAARQANAAVHEARESRKAKPAPLHFLPLDNGRQREYIKEASFCATSLLPPTPTTPTVTLRRLMSSPSRKCSALFQRKPSKRSLRHGISHEDQPPLPRHGASLEATVVDQEQTQQLLSGLDAIIACKWNPLSRKGYSAPRLQRSRAYSSHQQSFEHPILTATQKPGHFRFNNFA